MTNHPVVLKHVLKARGGGVGLWRFLSGNLFLQSSCVGSVSYVTLVRTVSGEKNTTVQIHGRQT